ncbi:MAG: YfhO family protein [Rhodothermales bacterium]
MAKKKRPTARTSTSKVKTREAKPAPTPEWFAAWDNLGLAKQHVICVVLLVAAAFMFFAPVHFSGRTLVGGDTTRWRAMAESVIDYREATGDEALWATHAFSGMPAYALSYPTLVPQLDEIPRALRSFLWPTSHFLFLLGGMYLLVSFFTRNPLASVFSAVAFGMTTYLPVLLIAGHNSKFIALCFAPWLILAFAYALRKPGLLSGLLFAMACAINLRAGHYQITYYLVFLCGIWWLVEGVVAVRQKQALDFAKSTAWLVVGSVLALLMIAQPTLSVLEYKDFSQRGMASGGAAGEGSLAWEYAMAWSHAGHELWSLLIANAAGGGSSEVYWGPKIFTEGPHYVGGLVLLFAVLALVKVRTATVWGLGLATFFMLLFALGEYLEWFNRLAFNTLPFFDAWRVPETWLSVVALTLAVLAGFGLNYAATWAKEAAARIETTKTVQYAFAGAVGLVLVLMLGKSVFFDFEKEGEFDLFAQQVAQSNNVSPSDPRVLQFVEEQLGEIREQRIETFNEDALRTLIFIILGGLLLLGARYRKLPMWLALLLVAVLVVIDLTGVARRHLNEDRLTRATDAEGTIATFDYDRFLIDRRSVEGGGDGHFRVLSFERGNPMENARPSYHHESLGGYHAAKLRYYQDYIDHIYGVGGVPSQNAIDLMNGRYVIAPFPFPGMQEVFRSQDDPRMAVYENADAVDRAFFVSEVEVVDEPEAAWARLRDETFDPSATALVLSTNNLSTTPIDSSSTATVDLQAYGPREITWALNTDADRLLVVSEVYYPEGWTAYLNDEPVPIHRVDYLLRGVAVPAGQHTLSMRFNPRSHTLGTTIAGTTTALVYGGVLVLLGLGWRRRQAAEAA